MTELMDKERAMGRFDVEVDLANRKDLWRVEDGLLTVDKVRRVRISGLVDSGATRLVIPASVAQRLGLEATGNTKVKYADGRTAHRDVVHDIRLTYGGREGDFSAIVEPNRETILVGAIVLEELDMLVDCNNRCLVPRDPKEIISEIE